MSGIVNLGVTKIIKSIWSRNDSFVQRVGLGEVDGEGSKVFGLRTVFTLCTPSTRTRTF